MNGVQGVSLAVWLSGADGQPLMAADDVAFGSASDYFEVPFEPSEGEPWLAPQATLQVELAGGSTTLVVMYPEDGEFVMKQFPVEPE